jgi:ATP-dependent RNA helicase DDX19/DBP5
LLSRGPLRYNLRYNCRVDPEEQVPQALCMCPTRELVVQNLDVLRKMSKYTGVTSVGVNEVFVGRYMDPIRAQVVIGTAGKVTNLISKRKLALDRIKILVFDEADEMMKVDGFKDTSVRMINDVRKASQGAQILLFSATFDESIKNYCTKVRIIYTHALLSFVPGRVSNNITYPEVVSKSTSA